MIGTAAIESEPTAPACATPRDTFSPSAPKQLSSVSDDKGVNLIWEPNAEPDLAGYIVLRGEGADDVMKPLTPEPIHETSYRDTAVQQGRSYIYAVVAIDNATPPNQSEESNRQTEVIR
jgi:fibronectin type 3 domain-containing protein